MQEADSLCRKLEVRTVIQFIILCISDKYCIVVQIGGIIFSPKMIMEAYLPLLRSYVLYMQTHCIYLDQGTMLITFFYFVTFSCLISYISHPNMCMQDSMPYYQVRFYLFYICFQS